MQNASVLRKNAFVLNASVNIQALLLAPLKIRNMVEEKTVEGVKGVLVGILKAAFLALFISSCATAEEDASQASLPEFTLPVKNGSRGETLSSSAHKGKIIAIEFYFNGCPACNENHPNYERLIAEFRGRLDILWLQVGVDCDQADYDAWVSKHHPTAKVLDDCEKKVIGPLNVSRYPTFTVVNRDGVDVVREVGTWNDAKYQKLRDAIYGM